MFHITSTRRFLQNSFRVFLLLALTLSPLYAQNIDALKSSLDEQEISLDKGLNSEAHLTGVRDSLNPIIDKINDTLRELDPKLDEAQARLTQLTPPKPKEGEVVAPETQEVKTERENQTKVVAEIDAKIKQLKLLQVRHDQILQKITDRKRQLFTAQLFEHNAGLLDFRMWREAVEAVPANIRVTLSLLSDWKYFIETGVGYGGLFTSIILLGLFFAAWLFARKTVKRLKPLQFLRDKNTLTERALSQILIAIEFGLPPIILALACVWAFDFAQLIPFRVKPILTTLITAVGLFALTKGMTVAVFNPKYQALRLMNMGDTAAANAVNVMQRLALIVAVTMVLLSFFKVIYAPLVATVITTHIMLLLVAFTIVRYLWSKSGDNLERLSFMRPLLWLFAITLIIAALLGYSAFASYLVSRLMLILLVLCASRLAIALIDAVMADVFAQSGRYGEKIALQLGITPKRLELLGAILISLLRIVIIIGALMIVLGPWGIQSSDASARLDDQFLGLRLGDLHHSLSLGLIALFIIVAGLTLTKVIGNWVSEKILPRTDMDIGLQNSLTTIFGYCGFVISLFAALNFLGVSLGSITILAGALSVGIGFGLQSIVSNFVSGLILLAERPIRVGDSINVKGEEGRVKKISVRSTEIETFERSTVIIPNSELISGVVKNWTLANRQARITCAVRVAYDSDTELVMDELVNAAKTLKNVQKDPLPKVYLSRLLDNGIEFEVRVIVSNIDHILSTKSDLNMAILKRLNAAGIIVAPPEQRVQTKAVPKDA